MPLKIKSAKDSRVCSNVRYARWRGRRYLDDGRENACDAIECGAECITCSTVGCWEDLRGVRVQDTIHLRAADEIFLDLLQAKTNGHTAFLRKL